MRIPLSFYKIMKKLTHYFKPYKKEFILAPLFKLLEAILELLVPLFVAYLIDQAIPQNKVSLVWLTVGGLVLVAVFSIIIALLAQYFASKAAIGSATDLSADLYRKIMRLSRTDRSRIGESSLTNRLTTDIFQIQTGINLFLRLFLRSPIIVLGSLVMAFMISPQLTLSFLVMVVLLVVIVAGLSVTLTRSYSLAKKQLDKMVNLLSEQLQGMRVIRAFNRRDDEIEAFEKLNLGYFKRQGISGQIASLLSPLTFITVNVTLMVIIRQGYVQIQFGNLTQGMVVALINYLSQILAALLASNLLVTALNQSIVSWNRVSEVLELEEEDIDAKRPIEQINHALLANQMDFTYPLASEPALTGIDFSIETGQTFAIIGGTGSGKSTLVNIMMGLYPDRTANFSISDAHLTPESIREWRSWVAYVPQKAELFKGTVRSNLSLGAEEAVDDAQLWHALEIAQAASFIREAGGLDAEVVAFGRNFSGGQRQRLTIARALVRQTPFLILDDATSALDYLTESRLLKAIKEKLKGVTLIMVSQRTTSIKNADEILVLDKGQQVGLGTHEDLLRTCPIYQDIHQSQERGNQHEG